MAKPSRKRDYIFQRPGSSNWYVKLRSPGEKRKEVSLGTSERAQAEILALPMVAEHKKRLLAARPRLQRQWQHKLEPGRMHAGPDGGRIFATDRELHYLDASGATVRTEPNGADVFAIVGNGVLSARDEFTAFDGAYAAVVGEGVVDRQRPKVPAKTGDDLLLETYIAHASLKGYKAKEVRDVWALFRSLCDKPLKDCSRDDGRKLVTHYKAQGMKRATLTRKLVGLVAMVNLAIAEGRLSFNMFTGIIPKRTEEELKDARKNKRQTLSDEDIARLKANLGKLDKNDQLLLRLLACTGMRPGEPFEIDCEYSEQGVRYVIVGTKTEQSYRRVPLPAGVLPLDTIKGKLFTGRKQSTLRRLNRFLRDHGIKDKRKVLYSLRHRAKDRLRALGLGLPDYDKLAEAIFGRDEPTIGEGYGEGFPVTVLKEWIDKIGF